MGLNIPWHQYALIVYLSEMMQENGLWFGKTALQKLIFLLQSVYKVPVGYKYSLYIHEPYCKELIDDLDYVEFLGGVSIMPDSRGFKITPASEANFIKGKGSDFLNTYKESIEALVNEFGTLKARDLELRSTIIYTMQNVSFHIEESILDDINSMKPHFSREEIRSVLSELKQKGMIPQKH